MSFHFDELVGSRHPGINLEYNDASARTGDTSLTSGHLGSLAWQKDNNTVWLLTSTTPTWAQVGGYSSETDRVILSVRKGSTGTITHGQPFYISGYNVGGWIEVELSDADDSAKMPCAGLADGSITNSATGKGVILGTLEGVDTSSWAVKTALYVSTTEGQLTNSKPIGASTGIQKIGSVLRQHASQGVIMVSGANRTNDLPNLSQNKLWLGNSNGVPQETGLGEISHTSLDDIGSNTHAQIDSHLASTSNPHSVTYSQTGAAAASHTHTESDITDLDHTDADAIHDNVAAEIDAVTSKATPVGADIFLMEDSADSWNKKKSALSSISHTLLADKGTNTHAQIDSHLASTSNPHSVTYSQTGAAAASHTHTESDITDLDHTDTDAIHDNVAGEINAVSEKATPVAADLLLMEDSADSNNKKKLQLSSISHTLLADKGTNTHAQIDTHLASTSNPHSVTYTQTGAAAASHTHTESDITDLDHDDTDAIHDNVAAEIDAVTSKATPVGADIFLMEDSADSWNKKKSALSSISHTLLSDKGTNTHAQIDTHLASTSNPHSVTYSQTGAAAASHTHTESDITDLDHTDTDAIHDNVAGEINAITTKATPVSGDMLIIEDSADSNNKKKVTVGSLPGGSGTDDDAIHDNVAGEINAVTAKTSPVAADILLIEDSAATWNKKKLALSNISHTLLADKGTNTHAQIDSHLASTSNPHSVTYSQTGAAAASHTHTESDITDLDHDDTNAIHDNVAAEINAITNKATAVLADILLGEDSAASWAKKKFPVSSLPYVRYVNHGIAWSISYTTSTSFQQKTTVSWTATSGVRYAIIWGIEVGCNADEDVGYQCYLNDATELGARTIKNHPYATRTFNCNGIYISDSLSGSQYVDLDYKRDYGSGSVSAEHACILVVEIP